MTPQLQQAIKLLQLSSLDLAAYVESELERNPLLERDDSEPAHSSRASSGESDGGGQNDARDTPETADTPSDSYIERNADAAQTDTSQFDTGHENLYADEARADTQERTAVGPQSSGWETLKSSGNSAPGGGGRSTGEAFDFDANLSRELTLHDHLNEQLSLSIADPVKRLIGSHLVDMVDEAGYVAGDLERLAERLGTRSELVVETLEEMQRFEPAGVMARDLAECLGLQLREKDRLDPAMQALLDNIEHLAAHDFKMLQRVCEVSREDLADMIGEIRELNPKPGLAFGSVVVQPVVPDVFVREHADQSWLVELNTETLPRVLVNQQYYATVSGATTRDEDKTYLTECFANANWLVKSLDQRAKTILKVSREIVRQQDMFLAYGIEHLKPLNLKSVADAIEMHESTVSRVTANKYIATPRGIFELKYFFTAAIASAQGGDDHSAEAVRHRIKTLIDSETPDAILSDDKIVSLLNDAGIDIARRTVAKYREAMRIPSSVQRRRQKRAEQLTP